MSLQARRLKALRQHYGFQSKSGDAIDLPQGFGELSIGAGFESRFKSFQNSEFVTSFYCEEKWKTEFLFICGIETQQVLVFSGTQLVEPNALLFRRGTPADAGPRTEIGMGTQEREPFLDRGGVDYGVHAITHLSERRKRTA